MERLHREVRDGLVLVFVPWITRAGARTVIDGRVSGRLRIYSIADAIVALLFELLTSFLFG